MPFPFTADQQRIWSPFPKPQCVSTAWRPRSQNMSLTFLLQTARVERQTIQVAIESVYDLHIHACLCVAFTTGKLYGGTSLVCRRWCDYSNKKI